MKYYRSPSTAGYHPCANLKGWCHSVNILNQMKEANHYKEGEENEQSSKLLKKRTVCAIILKDEWKKDEWAKSVQCPFGEACCRTGGK